MYDESDSPFSLVSAFPLQCANKSFTVFREQNIHAPRPPCPDKHLIYVLYVCDIQQFLVVYVRLLFLVFYVRLLFLVFYVILFILVFYVILLFLVFMLYCFFLCFMSCCFFVFHVILLFCVSCYTAFLCFILYLFFLCFMLYWVFFLWYRNLQFICLNSLFYYFIYLPILYGISCIHFIFFSSTFILAV